jgi:hypothetical protein
LMIKNDFEDKMAEQSSLSWDRSDSLREDIFQRHQLFIGTCLNDSLCFLITSICILEKVSMLFRKYCFIVEKNDFFSI